MFALVSLRQLAIPQGQNLITLMIVQHSILPIILPETRKKKKNVRQAVHPCVYTETLLEMTRQYISHNRKPPARLQTLDGIGTKSSFGPFFPRPTPQPIRGLFRTICQTTFVLSSCVAAPRPHLHPYLSDTIRYGTQHPPGGKNNTNTAAVLPAHQHQRRSA